MAADIPVPLRHSVHGRASGLCEYCRTSERLTGYTLEVDHIVPSSRGGESVSDNLCLCCRRCNAHKSNRLEAVDPQTGQLVSLFNPRTQAWSEHFAWSDDGTQIRGLTDCARATIDTLRMNDPLMVQTRALWVAAGWHPPRVE